ncbi:MAG TPA: CoA transferase [Dehalococcoidia bacterium]|nr:CoA transferase [Dehalococcoidia bacterium]
MPKTENSEPRVLDGIRVVEFCDFVAGPFAGRILADFGAEVIKVELPRGDRGRRFGPFAPVPGRAAGPHRETGALYLHYNTNKQSLRIDLSTHTGHRLLNALIDDADVFLSDLTPGEQEHFGLTSGAVRNNRPWLIVASVTPYGLDGPAADLPTTPLTRMHSAGTAHVLVRGLGSDLGKPISTGGNVNEADGGMACAIATIGALIARGPDRGTGDGQVAEVSVQEAMSSLDRVDISIARHDGAPTFSKRPAGFGGLIKCQDGYVVSVMPQPHQWAGMVHAMGDPDWALDENGDLLDRGAEGAEKLDQGFREWCATRPREEIYRTAQSHSAPVGAVYRPSEVMASEQERARAFFSPIDHPDAGRFDYTTTSALYSETAAPPRQAAPGLGSSNAAILRSTQPLTASGWSAATARRAGVA